ncbi:MAG: CDP-alcohol phosphatidyltransferase family protein [Sphingomonadales bacterium]|jgi:CDP-diacylglycerol--glycerol-3-phosphate 3-phosphatidyltransferase
MKKKSLAYYLINGITLYRVLAAPFLLGLLLSGPPVWFKWMVALSFFTDMIDGVLARFFRVNSTLGARLDSIGDDLTVLITTAGLLMIKPELLTEQWMWLLPLVILFLIQTAYALYRYKRISSFHTRLAKLAAFAQGLFLLTFWFFDTIHYPLFYTAVIITMLELAEEIVLVAWFKEWTTDVKGLYWAWKKRP